MMWDKDREIDFFIKSLKIATPEQLFYTTEDGRYYAYWPKGFKGKKSTLQSRNSFIGSYTEKFSSMLLGNLAAAIDGYAIRNVVCDDLGLSKKTPADLAICKKDGISQKAQDILLIIEVKMSIVWNWELIKQNDNWTVKCIGDHTTHAGNPGLLRSDTMLKAIGKSINIRVSSIKSSKIPIIVLGNTPIAKSYYDKVDHLRDIGIVQGFWSLNPRPFDDKRDDIKKTRHGGFIRFDNYNELEKSMMELLREDREFFASMQSKKRLGEIIQIANKEIALEKKAEVFLDLIRRSG